MWLYLFICVCLFFCLRESLHPGEVGTFYEVNLKDLGLFQLPVTVALMLLPCRFLSGHLYEKQLFRLCLTAITGPTGPL